MIITADIVKKNIGGVQSKLNAATIEPFLLISERWFKGKIGIELYEYLLGLEDSDELKTLAQGAMSWYAFSKAQPHIHVKVGDLGMMKNQPQNTVALTKWEYLKIEESNLGMIDLFLELFFQKIEDYEIPNYSDGKAAKERNSYLIRSATELTEIIPTVRGSVRLFEELKTLLRRNEEYYLREVMTNEVFDSLIEARNNANLLEKDAKIVELAKRTLAFYTFINAHVYLSIIIDTEGIRVIEKSDSTRNEVPASSNKIDNFRLEMKSEAELSLSKLKEALNAIASESIFPSYYEKYLKRQNVESDECFDPRAYPIL